MGILFPPPSDFYHKVPSHPSQKSKTEKAKSEHEKEKLSPKEMEKNEFKEKFIAKYEDAFKNFEHLKLSHDELEIKLNEYMHLSESFEYNGDLILSDVVEELLDKINQKIVQKEITSDPAVVKSIINDAILFTSLVPSRIEHTSSTTVSRQVIEVITPAFLLEILRSIVEPSVINLEMDTHLKHLVSDRYVTSTIPQKMLLLNMSVFEEGMRSELANNKIFNLINESPYLLEWMFNCSGGLEQTYLNTCVSASFCQNMLSRVLILPQALFLSEELVKTIHEKLEDVEDKTIKEYVQERLTQYESLLSSLEQKLIHYSGSSSSEKIKDLTLQWSDTVQKLGLLINPHFPSHPTLKPISNQWMMSAVLMTPIVLIEHLIGVKDNPPEMFMRTKGISVGPLERTISGKLKNIPYTVMKEEDIHIIKGRISDKSEAQKKAAIERLWMTVFMRNGIYMGEVGHQLFLKAIVYKDQKLFLIADPMRNDYQLQTFSQLLDYCRVNKPNFFI